MNGKKLGFALCGSFCTLERTLKTMAELAAAGWEIQPIMSPITYETDTRFGAAEQWRDRVEGLCGRPIWHTVPQVEPIGPRKLLDILLVAPCTGNTLGKLANGITDTPVTMAVKAHLRGDRPVVLAVSTNDGLSGSATGLGALLCRKNYYFVPFGQDDPLKKPTSLCAELSLTGAALEAALRGEQLQPLPLRIRHHLIGHLVDGLLADLAAAFGAVRHAHARIEQAQIVVDLRHGAHGGTGISRRGLLVDGNGGGQTLNGVDIRLFHLPQKHARIGGQALHIAALSLGVNGVKSQAGFAGPAQAREHHQLVARDFQCDVFQIMFARAANDELVLQGIDRPLCLYGRAGINAPRSARTPASLRPAWRHAPRRNASWYRGAYR